MPVWHKAAQSWRKDNNLVLLGVTQEQHPERCHLFAQWKKLDFPILHDPINILGLRAVPVLIAIDEHGIVRQTRPQARSFKKTFLDRSFKDDAKPTKTALTPTNGKQDYDGLKRKATKEGTAEAWLAYGDALLLWHPKEKVNDAIAAYEKALKLQKNGSTLFRLGVARRARYEQNNHRSEEFQKAIDFWTKALETNPGQYIWRRRIQQYGPRLDKPYPFYDWVSTAQKEIRERGEEPVLLPVLPTGAEIAKPSRSFAPATTQKEPDPKGKIPRDKKDLIIHEVTIVPASNSRAGVARVFIRFYPNTKRKSHWNNEGERLILWAHSPDEGAIAQQYHTAPQPEMPLSTEPRTVSFEIKQTSKPQEVKTYALFNVCEDINGTCQYLRRDIRMTIPAR